MKKAKVVHLGNSKVISILRSNIIIVIFAFIFTLGLLVGCLMEINLDINNILLIDNFINIRSNTSFFVLFFASFLLSFIFLFSVYLFGTSLLGLAFIPFIILIRGLFFGILLSQLYNQYGITGIVYNLLTIIPGAIISIIVLISGCINCINLSYSLGKIVISDGQTLKRIDIKKYCLSFCLLCFLTLVSALFETFMSYVFRNFFEFGVSL